MSLGNRVEGEVGLNIKPFQQGISKVGSELRSFSSGQLSAVGSSIAAAFTVGAITRLAMDAVALGGKFDDLSKRTGLSAEELQRLDYAAKQNSSSIDAMVGSLQKLAVARQNALGDKGGESAKAFADLGISIADVARLSPEQLFYRIADAVQKQGAATNNAASMTALLGRGFGELVPMMAEGGDGLRKMADEATRLGVVLSTDTIQKLDILGDKLTSLKAQSISWAATFGMNVVSGYQALIEETTQKILAVTLGTGSQAYKDAYAISQGVMAGIGAENLGLTPPKPKAALRGENLGPPLPTSEEKKQSERDAKRAENDRLASAFALMDLSEKSRKMDEKDALNAKKDALELADIQSGRGISVSAPVTDNLARIGGYVGGSGDYGIKVAEKQLAIQEKMVAHLQKIAEREALADIDIDTY